MPWDPSNPLDLLPVERCAGLGLMAHQVNGLKQADWAASGWASQASVCYFTSEVSHQKAGLGIFSSTLDLVSWFVATLVFRG